MNDSDPLTHASAFLIFWFFFAMKWCPIAAKLAGSIGILRVLCIQWLLHIGVWTFARFVRPSLSHHTLYMGNLVPTYFPVGQQKTDYQNKYLNKNCHRTDFEADRWPETGRPFFWPKRNFSVLCKAVCLSSSQEIGPSWGFPWRHLWSSCLLFPGRQWISSWE